MSRGRSTSFDLMDVIRNLIDEMKDDDNSKFQKELKAQVSGAIKKNIFLERDKLKLKNLCTPYDLDYNSDDEDLFKSSELSWIDDFSIRNKLKGLKLADFGLDDISELPDSSLWSDYDADFPDTQVTLFSLIAPNLNTFGDEQIEYIKLIVNRHKQEMQKATFTSAAFRNKTIIPERYMPYIWCVVYEKNSSGLDSIVLKINAESREYFYDLQEKEWIEDPQQGGSTKKITTGLDQSRRAQDDSETSGLLEKVERPKKTNYKVKWALFRETYLSPFTSPIASFFIWLGFKLGICNPESTINQFISEVRVTKGKKTESAQIHTEHCVQKRPLSPATPQRDEDVEERFKFSQKSVSFPRRRE